MSIQPHDTVSTPREVSADVLTGTQMNLDFLINDFEVPDNFTVQAAVKKALESTSEFTDELDTSDLSQKVITRLNDADALLIEMEGVLQAAISRIAFDLQPEDIGSFVCINDNWKFVLELDDKVLTIAELETDETRIVSFIVDFSGNKKHPEGFSILLVEIGKETDDDSNTPLMSINVMAKLPSGKQIKISFSK